MREAARLIVAVMAVMGVGAAGLGCPSRDLEVEVTDPGAGTVALGCESFRDACSTKAACRRNVLLCDQSSCLDPGGGRLHAVCTGPAGGPFPHPEWDPLVPMGLQLLLFAPGEDALTLKSKSACLPLNLRPCLANADALDGLSCKSPGKSCAAAVSQAAVTQALGSGLTFDGFTSPEDGLLVAALFAPGDPAAPHSCDPVAAAPCDPHNMVAAAGFAAPIGGGTFDVTCVSCQSGPHASLGRDTGPCPVTTDACFLQRVAEVLLQAAPP